MKLFHLRLDTLILRFYLVMLVILVAGFCGVWAISFLALPIFMTCLMGMDLGFRKTKEPAEAKGQKVSALLKHMRTPTHQTV